MSLLRRIERVDKNQLLHRLLEKLAPGDVTTMMSDHQALRVFLDKQTETDAVRSQFHAILNTVLQEQNLSPAQIRNIGQLYDDPAGFFAPMPTFRQPQTTADLVKWGTVSAEAIDFLNHAVKAGLNIIIAGPRGAGKTALMQALHASSDRRFVEDLTRDELSTPPYIGTVLADSLTDVLERVGAHSLDLIVFIRQQRTGSRRVQTIAEMNPDYTLTPLWEYDDLTLKYEMADPEGVLQFTNIVPRCLDRLVAVGLDREKFMKRVNP